MADEQTVFLEGSFFPIKIGASEGIRTLDTHVGNVMLYQAELRSLPIKNQDDNAILADCNTKNVKNVPASGPGGHLRPRSSAP